MKFMVRESCMEDADYIGNNLRRADLMELRALEGKDIAPSEVLKKGINDSLDPKTGLFNGRPALIAGVVPDSDDETIGYIWMMGTNDIFDHKITFLRESRPWLDRLMKPFRAVSNCVDKRNTLHVKWLKWMGFCFINEVTNKGPEGVSFYEFIKLSDV